MAGKTVSAILTDIAMPSEVIVLRVSKPGCPACQADEPRFAKFCANWDISGARIEELKLDSEGALEQAVRLGVDSVPAYVLLADGAPLGIYGIDDEQAEATLREATQQACSYRNPRASEPARPKRRRSARSRRSSAASELEDTDAGAAAGSPGVASAVEQVGLPLYAEVPRHETMTTSTSHFLQATRHAVTDEDPGEYVAVMTLGPPMEDKTENPLLDYYLSLVPACWQRTLKTTYKHESARLAPLEGESPTPAPADKAGRDKPKYVYKGKCPAAPNERFQQFMRKVKVVFPQQTLGFAHIPVDWLFVRDAKTPLSGSDAIAWIEEHVLGGMPAPAPTSPRKPKSKKSESELPGGEETDKEE
jgi:thiol-disulfide isomerase/thioredoxin